MRRVTDKQYVLVIPDGAADRLRIDGRSPLDIARTEAMDMVARRGINGRMRTLDSKLPRGSLVAHLGMLGWDPRVYYPHGRSSCEALALDCVDLETSDLTFRANLVRLEGEVLESYSANGIESSEAAPLVHRLNAKLRNEFPDFELYHNLDFRNTLVVRGQDVDPRRLQCLEPHEHQGETLDPANLILGEGRAPASLVQRLNRYTLRTKDILRDEPSNMVILWSPAKPLKLPPFAAMTGFKGEVSVIAAMDFLQGVAKAGGMNFHKTGNGRVDTDYRGKGSLTINLLKEGCSFVICHINAPDEAAHMGEDDTKIGCLEEIDRHIVAPILAYFRQHRDRLGGLAIMPDHFTNSEAGKNGGSRGEAHSLDPVPFALWNGRRGDSVECFSEDASVHGYYGDGTLNHLDLLALLGITTEAENVI